MEKIETKECVGCGLCCTKAKCGAGARLYKSALVCPALIWVEEKGRHVCDLMELPGILGETYRKELHAGEGCCMGLFNDWRTNLQDRTKNVKDICVNDQAKNPIPYLMQKFLAAIGREPFLNGDAMSLVISAFTSKLINEGMSETEAKYIQTRMVESILQQRPSFIKGFSTEVAVVNTSGKGSR